MRINFEFSGEPGQKLGQFLRRQEVSASMIRSLKFIPGGITVNGFPVRTGYRLSPGDRIELDTSVIPEENSAAPEKGSLEILYEDENFMVVNKPRKIACHPSFTRPGGTLANFFSGIWRERGQEKVCRILNRLDRPVSGAVLIALDRYGAGRVMTEKIYLAVACGQLPIPRGKVYKPISRQVTSVIERHVSDTGKYSVTGYRTLKAGEKYTLARVRPLTGRTHQIRVHFAYMGAPLAGDDLYGGSLRDIDRVALHCRQIKFSFGGRRVTVNAPVPEDMKRLCAGL